MNDDATQADDSSDEVCPHCGGVLDLALALETDQSVLRKPRPRSKREVDSA